jgi:hypothetical protein
MVAAAFADATWLVRLAYAFQRSGVILTHCLIDPRGWNVLLQLPHLNTRLDQSKPGRVYFHILGNHGYSLDHTELDPHQPGKGHPGWKYKQTISHRPSSYRLFQFNRSRRMYQCLLLAPNICFCQTGLRCSSLNVRYLQLPHAKYRSQTYSIGCYWGFKSNYIFLPDHCPKCNQSGKPD